MAAKIRMHGTAPRLSHTPISTVSAPVGPDRGANLYEDVWLIQWLLQRAAIDLVAKNRSYANTSDIKVDGIAGPRTYKMIKVAQTYFNSRNTNDTLDGVFDPVPTSGLSPKGRWYALVALNWEAAVNDPAGWESLPKNPDVPISLRRRLQGIAPPPQPEGPIQGASRGWRPGGISKTPISDAESRRFARPLSVASTRAATARERLSWAAPWRSRLATPIRVSVTRRVVS